MKSNQKLHRSLYQKATVWAEHPHALYYLAFLSFSEASFFPIPPDFMLAPMTLSQPKNAWRYATVTTLSSVLGGLLGYFLGMFFFDLLHPYIVLLGYEAAFDKVKHWFLTWGVWALFFAGFSPIPYKVFTLSCGAAGMPLVPFILASCVGRGSRFYLVSGLIWLGGERMKDKLKLYRARVGWFLVAAIIISLIVYIIK
jgi:membrane protein YqaA with SNARE-associated domain